MKVSFFRIIIIIQKWIKLHRELKSLVWILKIQTVMKEVNIKCKKADHSWSAFYFFGALTRTRTLILDEIILYGYKSLYNIGF